MTQIYRIAIPIPLLALAMSIAIAARLIEIALWAVLFRICGECPDLSATQDDE
jgi:hypothetical protein